MNALQNFGGTWTELKLIILKEYASLFQNALKNQPFSKIYIDAFAGTGYRDRVIRIKSHEGQNSLFPEMNEHDIAEDEMIRTDGSAKLILKVMPQFDEYFFIDKSVRKTKELDKLKQEYPHISSRINIERGDANDVLKRLCTDRAAWRSKRAVLFLDPFGMSVSWETLEIIKQTEAIDIWYLFPLGMGVNRMLTRKIPKSISRETNNLDSIFGTNDWRNHFYAPESRLPFPEASDNGEQEYVKSAPFDKQKAYVMSRLSDLFGRNCVIQNPLQIENSKSVPMYLLCFMSSNSSEKASQLAIKFAKHTLGIK